ncbi:DUF6144 family protein [Hungatella hathewayi]|uniref:DUF6144 family protein n=1 Tax=Hungatella hathewayi TaxID=154046 RepID=UPI00356A2DDE
MFDIRKIQEKVIYESIKAESSADIANEVVDGRDGEAKSFFEQAFACKADVELLKSIKMGDNICLMKIILHDPVF